MRCLLEMSDEAAAKLSHVVDLIEVELCHTCSAFVSDLEAHERWHKLPAFARGI